MFSPQIELPLKEGKLKIHTYREIPFEKTINEMVKSLPKLGDE